MTDETRREDAADQAEARKDEAQESAPDFKTQDDRAPELRAEADHEAHEPHEQEKSGGSVAGTLLTWLLLLLVGAGLALWGAPKVAPHLPASVAKYLVPASAQPDAEFRQALDQRFAELDGKLAEAQRSGADELGAAVKAAEEKAATALEAAQGASESAAAAFGAAEKAQTAAQGAMDQASQALQAASVEPPAPVDQEARDALSRFDERLNALSEAIRNAGDGKTDEALAARMAETESALSALRGQFEANTDERVVGARQNLTAQIAELAAQTAAVANRPAAAPERVAALETRIAELAQRMNDEGQARQSLSDSISQARSSARAGAALAELERAAAQGKPFADTLAELKSLGAEPPEAVAAAAGSGAPSYDDLIAGLPDAARAALNASAADESGEAGLVGSVLSKLEARVTGLPLEAQEGAGPAAVLSRARAAILNRDAAAALTELEGLSAAARDAMSGWIADAGARAALDAGLDGFRDQVRASL